MNIELTESQRQALEGSVEPVRVTAPGTNVEYVLIRADLYEQIRKVIDGVTRRADWDDPVLDAYERYR